jgi:phage gpG-like protein
MSFKFTGDFASLKRFQKRVEESPQVLQVISANMAEEAIDLIKQGFREQADPDGNAWKPKKKDDGRAILTGKTGRLKGGWKPRSVTRKGFRVSPSVTYGAPHQSGTKHMVARKMVPGKGLPLKWRKAFVETAQEILEEYFDK